MKSLTTKSTRMTRRAAKCQLKLRLLLLKLLSTKKNNKMTTILLRKTLSVNSLMKSIMLTRQMIAKCHIAKRVLRLESLIILKNKNNKSKTSLTREEMQVAAWKPMTTLKRLATVSMQDRSCPAI